MFPRTPTMIGITVTFIFRKWWWRRIKSTFAFYFWLFLGTWWGSYLLISFSNTITITGDHYIVVWIVSILPLMDSSPNNLFSRPFGDSSKVSKCNWYRHRLHVPQIHGLCLFFAFFIFIQWSAGTAKSTIYFFFLINTKFGLLDGIKWSICHSKTILYVGYGLCK